MSSSRKQLRFSSKPIKLGGHQDSVNGIAISSDGTIIASGSSDRTVKLWNIQTKKQLKTFQFKAKVYGGVAFSPNNQYLAYGGDGDFSILLFDLTQNYSITTLKGHHLNVFTLIFSQDSQFLFSGGADRKLIIWDLNLNKRNKEIHSFDTDSPIWTIMNSPDNKLISCVCDYSINVWDMQTKMKIICQKYPHNYYGYGLCSSTDSSMLISSGYEGLIKIWKIQDGDNKQKFLMLIKEIRATFKQIWKVILTNDEQYLISICNRDQKIMIHLIESGNLIQELFYGIGEQKSPSGQISISKDMNVLVSGGEDKIVKIWKRQ